MSKKSKTTKVCIKCNKVITGKGYVKAGELYCCNVCCKKSSGEKLSCEFC